MKILLVQPSSEQAIPVDSAASAPLWPCILSRLTSQHHDVDFIQTSFEKITEERIRGYDLVGISVWTHTSKQAYEIGDMCKRLNVKCVMGGIHPFVMPNEAIKHCDSVVLGEAEYVWQSIVRDAERNKLQRFYRCDLAKPVDIPSPDFSIVRKYKYAVENVIETTRGCPFNCDFCSATLYSGNTYRYKPVEKITEEIEAWKNPKSVAFFTDVNVISNFEKAKELFKAITPYNLTWWGDASVNVANDEELLKLASESGCAYLVIGFESISKESLTVMNKVQNLRSDFKHVVKKLHDYNIDVIGSFIFGSDADTKDVFKEICDFVHDADIDLPAFSILTPYPGTRIYKRLKQEGRILTEDWSLYTRTNVVFQPKKMTTEELIEGYISAWEETYSFPRSFGRSLSRWRGLRQQLLTSAFNFHSRKKARLLRDWHDRKEAER